MFGASGGDIFGKMKRGVERPRVLTMHIDCSLPKAICGAALVFALTACNVEPVSVGLKVGGQASETEAEWSEKVNKLDTGALKLKSVSGDGRTGRLVQEITSRNPPPPRDVFFGNIFVTSFNVSAAECAQNTPLVLQAYQGVFEYVNFRGEIAQVDETTPGITCRKYYEDAQERS